ncbi:PAS domain-containing sensor histidine kinase [Sphingobacteriaceae bacterium]|nr:PAS domain-containing sensor histidine kinase [Sphingobacteriaceae bacterium]
MKIKTKLSLGLGLLLALIVVLAVIGARQVNVLSADTKNILDANYNTLDYARRMLVVLDEVDTDSSAANKFMEDLNKQENNITEEGEKELTDKLAKDFKDLKNNPTKEIRYTFIRKDLTDIMFLNMLAIERKSNIAKKTAADSTIWIALTGTFCFLIAFTLFLNLPGTIANPIKELTASIREIADMNYSERVHFEEHNEFGELANSFNSMAKKLEEYNNSNLSNLMMEKKRIETLINNMHDPVIGLDEKKMILFANNEACRILGVKPGKLIGKPAHDVAIVNDLMRALVKELLNSEDQLEDKKPMKIYADNKESYFEKEIIEISVTPTGETEAKHIGHFIVLKNITPFKELDFAKSNFIATISHELKTPISAIKVGLQLLENKKTGEINEEQQQLISSIKDDSNRLLKITGELLNLSQVETGNIQLNIQASDPIQILNYALEAVKIPADQKKIKLKVRANEKLPMVKADNEKTAWVLINLLTNAIRYSKEESEILIDIKQNQNRVFFSVKDFGKGIEQKYKDKIFTRYFQVPGTGKSGTGLGLSISKEFIEGQGGEIMVESSVGEGSTFSFFLNS